MKLYRQTFKAMGTSCELQFYAISAKQASSVVAMVITEVGRLESRYSRYREDSLLSRINQAAAQGKPITVDAETAGLLNYAATCYQQSAGLFDITSGILRQAWSFRQAQLPAAETIATLLDRVGWDYVDWQPPVLSFKRLGLELDFGGIVKEYAADRVASLCWSADIQHGLVNLGGDIKIIGPQANGEPWKIAIRDPRTPEAMLTSLALTQGALASSGDYERCMIIAGQRYGHLLNPKTGWPVQYLAAVSVTADFCVVAGSAATIAMLKADQGPQWLMALGLPHVWVNTAGIVGGTLV